jgi:hypothetical protein
MEIEAMGAHPGASCQRLQNYLEDAADAFLLMASPGLAEVAERVSTWGCGRRAAAGGTAAPGS